MCLCLSVRLCLCVHWELLYTGIDMIIKVSYSQLVQDMIKRKRKEVFGHNQLEIVPQISTLSLIDRSVDLVTPLSTQLTYEGLIDEIYNIKNCKMKRMNNMFDN